MVESANHPVRFNHPFITGNEIKHIKEAFDAGFLSGNGPFTKKCHKFFEDRYGFAKVLLTTSCTDALEMCAMLAGIGPGDEVIVPSYTFVSSALAFVRQGARIVFADSRADHPGIDENSLRELITPRTRAIVPVHYAGVACDMDLIMSLANEFNLLVIEDAAQAIDSFYKGRPLGSIGHLSAFSFHETKNIISGEGGMLAINDHRFVERAEILWEKGTNRANFFRGEVDKYGWVDTGSSFLPSEMIAAFLYAQLEQIDLIQAKRIELWEAYYNAFSEIGDLTGFKLPIIPEYATNNGHMFYITCKDQEERNRIIKNLQSDQIKSVFHYQSLHKSAFYANQYNGRELVHSDRYTDTLLRLPMHMLLTPDDVCRVVDRIIKA